VWRCGARGLPCAAAAPPPAAAAAADDLYLKQSPAHQPWLLARMANGERTSSNPWGALATSGRAACTVGISYLRMVECPLNPVDRWIA
jgi:hypothetical protein